MGYQDVCFLHETVYSCKLYDIYCCFMYEYVFIFGNIYVMPFWVMMMVFPRSQLTQRCMRSLLALMPLMLVYAFIILPNVFSIFVQVAKPQLSSIVTLLGSPVGAVVAWTHLLVWDLFVGRWIYHDSMEQHNVSRIAVSVCLFFTLMFGPIGLLCYLALKKVRSRA